LIPPGTSGAGIAFACKSQWNWGKVQTMTHVVPVSFAFGIALCLAMCLLTLGAHF